MKARIRTLSALLLLFLASCQREATDLGNPTTANPANPNNPTQPAGSGRLVALYARDSTLPAGLDTLQIARLSYDASGRVASVIFSDKQPSGDSSHLGYLYAGSDTLASRITNYQRSTGPFAGDRYDTTWLEYANGRLMADSNTIGIQAGAPPYFQVRRFAYNGNSVFFYRYDTYQPRPSATDTAIAGQLYTVTRTAGDITSQRDDSAYYNQLTGGFRFISNRGQYTATFDQRANPLFQAGRSFQAPFVDVEYFVEILTDGSITRRLPLTSTHTNRAYVPTGLVTVSHSYTFRPDGLPAKRITTEQSGGSTSNYTIYYMYQ
jgi:hypothetical protein